MDKLHRLCENRGDAAISFPSLPLGEGGPLAVDEGYLDRADPQKKKPRRPE